MMTDKQKNNILRRTYQIERFVYDKHSSQNWKFIDDYMTIINEIKFIRSLLDSRKNNEPSKMILENIVTSMKKINLCLKENFTKEERMSFEL